MSILLQHHTFCAGVFVYSFLFSLNFYSGWADLLYRHTTCSRYGIFSFMIESKCSCDAEVRPSRISIYNKKNTTNKQTLRKFLFQSKIVSSFSVVLLFLLIRSTHSFPMENSINSFRDNPTRIIIIIIPYISIMSNEIENIISVCTYKKCQTSQRFKNEWKLISAFRYGSH